MNINKKDIIQLLEQIATYMELKGENPFRINAYRRAAQSLERDVRSLSEIDDFTQIKGIGQGTNDVIMEFVETGTSTVLEELKEDIPEGLIPLLQLPGLGGKRLSVLYKELNIVDAHTLKEACLDGSLETVRGFGKKTKENILSALQNMNKQPDRLPASTMLPIAQQIEQYLKTIPEINEFSVAGSLRRMKETVKDIDFIIATDDRASVRDALLKIDQLKEVIASGDTKISLIIEDEYDINIDFRLVEDHEFATTLHHFTGSKEHNVAIRQLAKTRGEKISEYGVEVEATGETLTFANEEQFFNHFNLHFVPPELREDKGELIRFKEEVNLLELDDIKGDLHMHTTWSDGAVSVEEMVLAAREYNYDYIAITDHSKFLQVANGLNEKRLREQREEIERLNEKYEDIHIFAGVEMDILPNGDLDFSTDFLKEMDIVIAAIHSSFNQSEEEIMARLFNALENPYVDIIAHPTGRIIGRREPYAVNVEALIEKAVETNTVLELNANPHRFDLSDYWVNVAQEMGARIAINTDAHRPETFHHMEYGVKVGRRGSLKKNTVMNTWNKAMLIDYLNRHK